MERACSACGNTQLRMPGFSDGMVPEMDNLQEWICANGHQTTPLEFTNKDDLKAFQSSFES